MNEMPASQTAGMIHRETGEDAVCVLTFDRPESGANIFDAATIRELNEHLDFIEEQESLQGLVITSGKKSIFIAGADLKTLLRQAQKGGMRDFIAEGQRVFNRLASLEIPTCAAIHGACAGGGYEVTLACDWRVASDDPATRIGLPETTLGLIPAWGGSTRLPRLVGPAKAADVITKGKLYSAAEALKIGLIDALSPRDDLIATAKRKLRDGKRPARSSVDYTAEQVSAVPSTGNAAPARAIEVIKNGLHGSFADSLRLELDAIVELGKTDTTQNLIRSFFLAEKYKRGSKTAPTEKIAHAAIIGAGVMGSGIAQWLSSRGVSVILRDIAMEPLTKGLANIDKLYAEAVKRGIVSEEKAKEGRARIVASADPGPMRDVEVVIEAASEKLETKKQIFADISGKAPHAAILATNTSALPITELAAETETPSRVIGLHFFNPVSRMKLVEVVVGTETSDETIERALAFTRQVSKTPIVVRDSPGFLVNRVLFPYLLDAAELFENGVNAQEIDDAVTAWGMPMGPLRLMDEIGIDVSIDIADTLHRAYGRRDEAPQILRRMLSDRLLGRKSGAGFYTYAGREQSANRKLDPWRKTLQELPRDGTNELVNRLVFLMTNEAARCLEEQVIASPEDADYGMILGTGFPAYRGGPLRLADQFGLRKILEKLDDLSRRDNKFTSAEILKKHARDGTTFYEDSARSAA